jgi:DNA-binding transcriptional regulator YhcF (GntR family)
MTRPRIVLDTSSGLAPWRQIHHQLTHLISGGTLPPGTRLPTIRQLARDLGVAAGTVARAYRELESAQLVATARGKGTAVADVLPATRDPELAASAKTYAHDAGLLGADLDTAVAALLVAWDATPDLDSAVAGALARWNTGPR